MWFTTESLALQGGDGDLQALYPIPFSMTMSVPVSLGGIVLVRRAYWVSLRSGPRGYDNVYNVHNPELLEERGRGNGPETRPGAKPSQRGCSPKPPRLIGNPRPLGRGGGQSNKVESSVSGLKFPLP